MGIFSLASMRGKVDVNLRYIKIGTIAIQLSLPPLINALASQILIWSWTMTSGKWCYWCMMPNPMVAMSPHLHAITPRIHEIQSHVSRRSCLFELKSLVLRTTNSTFRPPFSRKIGLRLSRISPLHLPKSDQRLPLAGTTPRDTSPPHPSKFYLEHQWLHRSSQHLRIQ